MAQITPHKGPNGTRYYCRVRIKRGGVVVLDESRSFPRKVLAVNWGKDRELALQQPGALERAIQGPAPVAELIEEYLQLFPTGERTKIYDLKRLAKSPIGAFDVRELTAGHLIRHIHWRLESCAPQTANNDLIWLRLVLRTMSAHRGLQLNLSYIDEATQVLRNHGQIARPTRRERLPTSEELTRLTEYFANRAGIGASKIPMVDLMWLAIYTGRRIEELCGLRQVDADFDAGTIWVRNIKHPRKKQGNDHLANLPSPAVRLLRSRPTGELFFEGFSHRSVGSRWQRACKLLGIDDLRWHDLRHEAATRLFEQGLTIPQVAQVTLHQSWATLQRYSHLQPRPAPIELWDILPST
jgi:integrase